MTIARDDEPIGAREPSPRYPDAPWDLVPFPELDTSQMEAILRRHAPGVPLDAVRRLPSTGVVNSIWALGDRLVVRVPKDLDEARSDTLTESVAAPAAARAGLRTPRLVAFDDRCDIVPVAYTVYEQMPGSGLTEVGADPRALVDVWRGLGMDLALLHEHVREVSDPDGRLDHPWSLEPGSGPEHVQQLAALTETGYINRDNAAWFNKQLDLLWPAVTEAVGLRRFVHDDVQPANVLVDRGRYVALIDWGDAGWGDPAVDFRGLPIRAIESVLAGYRTVRELEPDAEAAEARIWFFHLLAALGKLAHPPRPGPGSWNRPPAAGLAEIAAYLAEGGRIGRF